MYDQDKLHNRQNTDEGACADHAEQIKMMKIVKDCPDNKWYQGQAQNESVKQVAQVKIDGFLAISVDKITFTLVEFPNHQRPHYGTKGKHITKEG
jgi:hypothetical protein